jgi:hypothetical protein
VVIWYIFPRFGILDQEKSGNPGWQRSLHYFFVVAAATQSTQNMKLKKKV